MTHAPRDPGPSAPRRPRGAAPRLTALVALATLATLVAGLPAWAQPEPPVDLGPRWTPGQTSRYQFWNQRTQDTTMSGNNETRSAQTTIASTSRPPDRLASRSARC